ncbi:MAG: 1,6-anhydro-N-acetylmuramyl-L-alanine amidase AmpD [Burkholderiales bacterium]
MKSKPKNTLQKPRRWRIDRDGMLEGVRFIASPNSDERPPLCPVVLLVVHSISLPPDEFGGDGVIDLFTNNLDCDAHPYYRQLKYLKVSAHFLVRRAGNVVQFVTCVRRAWHAGASRWRGRACCNDFSVGVELEGCDRVPFSDAQYANLARLTRALRTAYPIEDVVGHCDIAPGRKTDPGPGFDWARYRSLID